MDWSAILSVIEKGLTLLPTMVSAGESIVSTVEDLKNLATGAQAGTVTADQVTALEAKLDAKIADFNTPLDDTAA